MKSFSITRLQKKIGVPVPKTVLLPSKDHPDDTTDRSFRNMAYPLDWDGIFKYVGFPAYMKPFDGGGWKEVYQIKSLDDLWAKYDKTKQYVMMLQEEIIFDDYFRCYCIGGKHVRIMQYEPRNPHHLRYEHGKAPAEKKLLETVKNYVIKLNKYLGYDFNTVEFAIRNGIPYAIDFCNPAPDAEVTSVGQDNFDWVVETAADYAIERAKHQKEDTDNLTWGEFVKTGAAKEHLLSSEKKVEKKADKKELSAGKVDHEIAAEAPVKVKASAKKKSKT